MPRHQGSPSLQTGPSGEHALPHKRSGRARADRPPAADHQAPEARLVSTRDKSDFVCPRPVLGLRFKLANGDLVPVPCGRSTCRVCSRRQAMITAAMIGLDAQDDRPQVVSTFTTRSRVTPALLREASHQIMKLVRAELGPVRYCHFLEFTTGKARRSGGVRRPHLHTLWKGVDGDAAPVIAGIAGHVLERIAGAYRHDVEEIHTPAGATMYVARHHLKESQAPPAEWGPTRRVRPGRGYWSRPSDELRSQAKAIVREQRARKRFLAAVEAAEDEHAGLVLDHEEIEAGIQQLLDRPAVRVVRICDPWEDRQHAP